MVEPLAENSGQTVGNADLEWENHGDTIYGDEIVYESSVGDENQNIY